jgi:putative membrane protein
MPHFDSLFPQPDRDRISSAIHDAERATSGEIVPFVVEQSDYYAEAIWRAAAIGGAVALVALAVAQLLADFWMPLGVVGVALAGIGLAALAGIVVALVPSLRCLLVGDRQITHRVMQRAVEAFVAEEVFLTRDRTGILIFLSLLERKVVVLGDSGINAKVKPEDWDEIVRIITHGIRSGRPADGLVEAIARCGRLLVEHGFAVRADDTNELPDALRFGGE